MGAGPSRSGSGSGSDGIGHIHAEHGAAAAAGAPPSAGAAAREPPDGACLAAGTDVAAAVAAAAPGATLVLCAGVHALSARQRLLLRRGLTLRGAERAGARFRPHGLHTHASAACLITAVHDSLRGGRSGSTVLEGDCGGSSSSAGGLLTLEGDSEATQVTLRRLTLRCRRPDHDDGGAAGAADGAAPWQTTQTSGAGAAPDCALPDPDPWGLPHASLRRPRGGGAHAVVLVARGHLAMEGCRIEAAGAATAALTVAGAGASADVCGCEIDGTQDPPGNSAARAGVLVRPGGRVRLRRCRVVGGAAACVAVGLSPAPPSPWWPRRADPSVSAAVNAHDVGAASPPAAALSNCRLIGSGYAGVLVYRPGRPQGPAAASVTERRSVAPALGGAAGAASPSAAAATASAAGAASRSAAAATASAAAAALIAGGLFDGGRADVDEAHVDVAVERCHVEACAGPGIAVRGPGAAASVSGSLVRDGRDDGLWLHGGARGRIKRNLVLDNLGSGVHISSCSAARVSCNVSARNLGPGVAFSGGSGGTAAGNVLVGSRAASGIAVWTQSRPSVAGNWLLANAARGVLVSRGGSGEGVGLNFDISWRECDGAVAARGRARWRGAGDAHVVVNEALAALASSA